MMVHDRMLEEIYTEPVRAGWLAWLGAPGMRTHSCVCACSVSFLLTPHPLPCLPCCTSHMMHRHAPPVATPSVVRTPTCTHHHPSPRLPAQVKTFKTNAKPAAVFSVPILEEGRAALAAMNTVCG